MLAHCIWPFTCVGAFIFRRRDSINGHTLFWSLNSSRCFGRTFGPSFMCTRCINASWCDHMVCCLMVRELFFQLQRGGIEVSYRGALTQLLWMMAFCCLGSMKVYGDLRGFLWQILLLPMTDNKIHWYGLTGRPQEVSIGHVSLLLSAL